MDSVRVESVVKRFGSVEALRGLDATFPEGAVGLLGPNGAGKSTLLKILLGLISPDSGLAEVRGIDVTEDPTQVRRRVGYMPEVDAILPGLTGAQAVHFTGMLCGMPRRDAHRRAHEVLYYVGLKDERYRKVEEYTAGMRQRLRMAQALVHDPELILLDEPTNGLDPGGREEILELIHDLATIHRKSVILCTHLLHDVEAVCEHVVVLQNGRKAVQGTVHELRQFEQGRWRVRVRGDQDAFRDALEAAGAEYLGIEEEMVQARIPEGQGAELVFQAAHASRCVVRELATSDETLTGAFLRAVGDGA